MRNILGADISKAKINFCLLSEDGEILQEGKIKNDLEGFEELYNNFWDSSTEVIFEATGVYSRRFQYFLELKSVYYVRMNPLQAKKEMDGLRITKNDAIDAKRLAILQLDKHYLADQSEEDNYLELRRLHRYYQEFNEDGARAKNRLHKCLQDTFSEIDKLFVGDNDTLYKLIEIFPHAAMVRDKSIDEVVLMIQSIYGKSVKRSTNTARKIIELSKKTAVSVPIDSCLVDQTRHWAKKVVEYKNQKNRIIDSMNKFSKIIEEIEIIESIPGLGKVNTLCLVAELGNVRRFQTPQKMNAYVGIDLRFNDSGQFSTTGFTTKRGNSLARKILFDIGISIIATSGHGQSSNISDWYKRRVNSVKGSKKKILIGVMDRILRLVHHMVIEQEKFSYT